jgi:hypothetical protein
MGKNFEKTKKQLNELREGFSKLQNETKETIKKVKETTQDMKKEYNKDVEVSGKKNRNPRNRNSLKSTKKYS